MTTGSTDLRPPWMPQASRWLLALGIAGSALAVGTVHTVTLCIVTVVLAAAAVLGWWGAEPMRARAPATLLLFTGIGLTLYTALQCVPMPIGWLAAIAPHNADVWSRALSPLREPGPSWAPITLDPIASRVEVLKGVAYLLAFVTALRVARRKEGVGFLSAVIVVTAVALAVAAVLHPAFGTRRLFGVFEPDAHISDRHIAPLLNPNQLAAYLNVAILLALVSALSPEPRVPRVIATAVALVLVSVQVWVASRGGVVAMVLGALLVAVLVRKGRAKAGSRQVPVTIVSAVAAAVGVVMIALSSQDATGELLSADVSKTELFGQAMRMVVAYPFWGAGRGSFASTFPRFRSEFSRTDMSQGHVTFSHPENVIAQWTTEWGVPVAILGLIAVLWALRPTAALARSTVAAGAWAALVAIGVENAADFSSEVPGVMLAVVVCAAIVVGGTAGRSPDGWAGRWSLSPRAVALAAGAVAGVALAAHGLELGQELGDDERSLYQATMAQEGPLSAVVPLARAAMLSHPSEPYFPFTVGAVAARERDASAIAWLGATLERAQVYGPAHLVLARVVGARSPSQARFEYRLAMEQAPELIEIVTAEAPSRVGHYWDALELVPRGKTSVQVLTALVSRLAERLPATCVRLDAEIAARAPTQPGPILDGARAVVQDLELGAAAPWCEGGLRDPCVQRAIAASTAAEHLDPGQCEPHELQARARVAAGDVPGALDQFAREVDGVSERVFCLEKLALLAFRERDDARTGEALLKIENAGCVEDDECSRNLCWAASIQEARGNTATALALFRRAMERAPEQDTPLENAARLAARAGLHVEAAEDYDRLARRHPAAATWKRAADAERDAAMKSAVKL